MQKADSTQTSLRNLLKIVIFSELIELQENVSLVFEELKIKSALVFRQSTRKLVGFTEMGELNEELRVL